MNGFNGALCSLLTFFSTAITGENSDAIPRWGGAKGISDSFSTSINLITDLNGKNIILPSTSTNEANRKYNLDIEHLKLMHLETLDPSGNNPIPPVYESQLTDDTDSDSFISQIKQEKELIIDKTIKVLESLQTLLSNIKTDPGMVSGLRGVQSLLGSFQNLVEAISNTVADNIVQVQDLFSKIILNIFFVIYGLFLGIAVASLSLLLVYMFAKCYYLRFAIHVMWNIIFFLTVLSFLLGCVFGVIGVVGFQFVPVINYIFSSQFLNSPESPFGSQSSSNMLETCINGDGDLATTMHLNPKTGATSQLNDLFQISVEIEKIKIALSSVSDSTSLPLVENSMKGYFNNIDSTSSQYKTVLDQLNTDYHTCDPSVQNMFWVSGQNRGTVEITENQPTEDYSCPLEITINNRIDFIKNSIQSNNANIDSVKSHLTTMKNDYRDLLKLINTDLTIAQINTISLVHTFEQIIGENSLYSMFNCIFMRYELIHFIDQLSNEFAESSRGIGICCIICSFASYIGVFLMMNSIYYYSQKAREMDTDSPTVEKQVNAYNGNNDSQRDNNKEQTSIYRSLHSP